MKPTGKIIVFKLAMTNDRTAMNRFCRQFYGYLDRSHNYRYQYKRKGFLGDFAHIRLQRGVIVVKKEDSKEIISFLKSYDAEIFARDITLTKADREVLGLDRPG